LDALNASQGNILDNEAVIVTLETLKREAAEVNAKAAATEQVMEDIGRTSAIYTPLAAACSRIYFALESLASVHFLYQFSLRFFLDVFQAVLYGNSNLAAMKDHEERIAQLQKDLFRVVYQRVSRTLLHEDSVTFAIRLAQIRRHGSAAEPEELEVDFLLRGGDEVPKGGAAAAAAIAPALALLTQKQLNYITELSALPGFANLKKHMAANAEDWRAVLDPDRGTPAGDWAPPASWESSQPQPSGREEDLLVLRGFRRLLLLKGLRPDILLTAAAAYVATVFGPQFLITPELQLGQVVEKESSAVSPLLLASTPGFDASDRVDNLAAQTQRPYRAIAIGSAEGFEMADKAIAAASKNGTWVLLKNVHLAPRWLLQLEKKLHTIIPHASFRLFMTAEIHPKLPASLLRQSTIFSFQPPPGIKANLLHSFSVMNTARVEKQPVERGRLYFLQAWFHAVVQERLRYAPLGWSKMFEFNEADQRCALDCVDYWLDSRAGGRANLSPDRIPWEALRTLLAQTVYGGRIDNDFDQRLLSSFLDALFSARSFDADFRLVDAEGVVIASPEGTSRAHFLKWVEALPEHQSPVVLGLPGNAERLLLQQQGRGMVSKLLKMQSVEEDTVVGSEEGAPGTQGDTRPAWIRGLERAVQEYSALLPTQLAGVVRTADKVRDPLFRCFERECRLGAELLARVQRDIKGVLQACVGAVKLSNHLRSIMTSLSKGVVPKDWQRYVLPEGTSLMRWVLDLVARLKQLEEIAQQLASPTATPRPYWLGGLLSPEAFMTATRQAAAQSRGWSLETLELRCEVSASETAVQFSSPGPQPSFVVVGLSLEGGAAWDFGRQELVLSKDMVRPLPAVRFWWEPSPAAGETAAASVLVPVYLHESRRELLFAVALRTAVPASVWYQRALALTAWGSDVRA
jgi:dynein heavy chain 1